MNTLRKIGDFVEFVEPKPVSKPVPERWLLLRVHPGREIAIAKHLNDRGAAAYVPVETLPRRHGISRRLNIVTTPVFYGTAFVADHDCDLSRLRRLCDGIVGYHMFGEHPVACSAKVMAEIHSFEASLQLPLGARRRKFKEHQRVRITGGPFVWFEGSIEKLDAKGRLRVLLDVLGREVAVELDETEIEAV